MEKPVKAGNEDVKELVGAVKILFPHLSNVPDAEIAKAIALAKRLGLDPIKREVHFVPYKGSLQLIVGYAEYIKRAERSGKLNGWNIETGRDDLDIFAEISIYRKDWEHPLKWRVYLNEVRKDTPSWKSMPLFMLRKVAIAQGFRLAFPEEVAELPYTEDEISATSEAVEEKPHTHTPTTISDAQARRLWSIARNVANEKGKTEEDIEKTIKEVLDEYGIEKTTDIPRKVYDEIVSKVEEKLKQ
jgi:phage recombination protein Bet